MGMCARLACLHRRGVCACGFSCRQPAAVHTAAHDALALDAGQCNSQGVRLPWLTPPHPPAGRWRGGCGARPAAAHPPAAGCASSLRCLGGGAGADREGRIQLTGLWSRFGASMPGNADSWLAGSRAGRRGGWLHFNIRSSSLAVPCWPIRSSKQLTRRAARRACGGAQRGALLGAQGRRGRVCDGRAHRAMRWSATAWACATMIRSRPAAKSALKSSSAPDHRNRRRRRTRLHAGAGHLAAAAWSLCQPPRRPLRAGQRHAVVVGVARGAGLAPELPVVALPAALLLLHLGHGKAVLPVAGQARSKARGKTAAWGAAPPVSQLPNVPMSVQGQGEARQAAPEHGSCLQCRAGVAQLGQGAGIGLVGGGGGSAACSGAVAGSHCHRKQIGQSAYDVIGLL